MTDQRFKPLSPDQMSPEQRRLADAILSRPRKSLGGPFSVFLYSPATGDAAQKLGAQVRFHSALPDKLKELAILVVARHWTAQYEWYAHHRLALAAGRRPAGLAADEQAIYDFANELLETKEVGDPTFTAVAECFGETAVVDL